MAKFWHFLFFSFNIFILFAMTACVSLHSQMKNYDRAIGSYMKQGMWHAANGIVDTAEFMCDSVDEVDITAWRERSSIRIKSTFSKSLWQFVEEANGFYSKGDISGGDKVRQAFRARYFGNQGSLNSPDISHQWIIDNSNGEASIPELLIPCIELAWWNMLSDHDIAIMRNKSNVCLAQINKITLDKGMKSIEELEAILKDAQVSDDGSWRLNIDFFVRELLGFGVEKWAPVMYAQYIQTVDEVKGLEKQVLDDCSAKIRAITLDKQILYYDNEIQLCIEAGNWNGADQIINSGKFKCEPHEMDQVDSWRERSSIRIKSTFSKSLWQFVEEANGFYSKGDISGGDKVRQAFRARYFGGGTKDELGDVASHEMGMTESLFKCFELAWVNMLSDRNISRMSVAFNGYLKQVEKVNEKGRAESIKELEAIYADFMKVNKWKDKIDLFMEMLADVNTAIWSPIDRSTYAQSIKKMEAIRNQLFTEYKIKWWNTRVHDRKMDYSKVAQLAATGEYNAAMQILSLHDWIVKPPKVENVVEFVDLSERAKVASAGLGDAIIRQIVDSEMPGVQYYRRDQKRGVLSVLIVGRVLVEDKSNKRKLREAGRLAQMQARAEFVRYMSTVVQVNSESRLNLVDDEVQEAFSTRTKEDAQAEVSNLVILATGIHKDEVVFILGWRAPELGMVTPIPMRRVSDADELTISPSVGAYL